MKTTLFGFVLAFIIAPAPALAQSGASGSCDRACLNRVADAYVAALLACDPAKAPLAANVKFTEQAQVRAVGEGLWKTALTGSIAFKIPVAVR